MIIQIQLTLLPNILHSSNELFLQILAVFSDLFPFVKEVVGSLLNRHCQDMSLLRSPLFLTGWSLVAGIHQSGHLENKRYFGLNCVINKIKG